MELTRSTSCGP